MTQGQTHRKALFRLPNDVDRAMSMRAVKKQTHRTAVLIEALRAHLGPELEELRAQSDQLSIEGESTGKKSA